VIALLIFVCLLVPGARAESDDTTCSSEVACRGLPHAVRVSDTGVTWVLVARNRNPERGLAEVWRDLSTGLAWSDRLRSAYSYYQGTGRVPGGHSYLSACGLDDALAASAGLADFRLPTAPEYRHAEYDGIRSVLPRMDGAFWSSTLWAGDDHLAFAFDGEKGNLGPVAKVSRMYLRCVRP
jgi:hypothetical protein